MQKSYLETFSSSCMSRFALSIVVAAVLLVGFACVGLFAGMLPVSEKVRAIVLPVGVMGYMFVVIAGVVGFALVLAGRRAGVMDEAFRSFGLQGQRYLLMGRQYAGSYFGREINVYFHISGGRYSRVPVLQFYAAGDIPTRVGVGTRNVLATVATNLLNRTVMPVDDPRFTDLEVYPEDETWARGLFSEPQVREEVVELLKGDLPGNLRALVIGPGSVNLTLRYFNPNTLDAEILRGVLNRLIEIAQLAERQPAPAVRVEESGMARRSRSDRRSIAVIVWVVIGVVLICPLLFGGIAFALLLMTGG